MSFQKISTKETTGYFTYPLGLQNGLVAYTETQIIILFCSSMRTPAQFVLILGLKPDYNL